MKLRLLISGLLILLQGCSVYKDYTFEKYYNSTPFKDIEFIMKDRTVNHLEAKDIALTKNTGQEYIVYKKNGEVLVILKDQVAVVKMTDNETYRKRSNFYAITIVTVVFIIPALIYIF
jgi:hypothetical protein